MIFNCNILILLHLIRLRLHFTPVAGYLVLCDIQHFMNFNYLLISALLEVHATFVMKGWIPLYPWGPQSAGTQPPERRGSAGATSNHPCVIKVQVRSICKLSSGTGGKAQGNTDFCNIILMWNGISPSLSNSLSKGKHQECQDLLGKLTVTLGWTRTVITELGADVPDSRPFPSPFLSTA